MLQLLLTCKTDFIFIVLIHFFVFFQYFDIICVYVYCCEDIYSKYDYQRCNINNLSGFVVFILSNEIKERVTHHLFLFFLYFLH